MDFENMDIEKLYNHDVLNELRKILTVYNFNKLYDTLDKKKLREIYKIDCPCGGRYAETFSNAHKKTNRHIQYITYFKYIEEQKRPI